MCEFNEPFYRPIPKLGRNELCHCGSGKKYKKCCLQDDSDNQKEALSLNEEKLIELLNSQAYIHNDARALDGDIIDFQNINASELKNEELSEVFRAANYHGQMELEYDLLLEIEKRKLFDNEEDYVGCFYDLIFSSLDRDNYQLIQKIRQHCVEQKYNIFDENIKFRLHLLDHKDTYKPLNEYCHEAISNEKKEENPDEYPITLIELAFSLKNQYPMLALVFTRAAIASYPDRGVDHVTLLDMLDEIASEYDIDMDEEPAEQLFYLYNDLEVEHEEDKIEISKLKNQLKEAESSIKDNQTRLKEAEKKLSENKVDIQTQKEIVKKTITSDDKSKDTTINSLRKKVEDLKALISEQQQQKRELRKELHSSNQSKEITNIKSPDIGNADDISEEIYQPTGQVLPPVFSNAYYKSCSEIPISVQSKAIILIGKIAGHDTDTWKNIKKIKRLDNIYRIRVNRDYRILFRWEKGNAMEFYEILPRQDLDTWIKKYI